MADSNKMVIHADQIAAFKMAFNSSPTEATGLDRAQVDGGQVKSECQLTLGRTRDASIAILTIEKE